MDSKLLIAGGVLAAYLYYQQQQSAAAAPAGPTPPPADPLTIDPTQPQQTNSSPITSAVPGVTSKDGVNDYHAGVVGSGTLTSVNQGSTAPAPGAPASGCHPGYQLDAAGVCTLYSDQILLAQINSIPWSGSVDIPTEQISRIDPQVLQSYAKYPGITPGTVLAYLLGLGSVATPNAIVNGSDGSAYQVINGVFVKQGTATQQTQPVIPVPAKTYNPKVTFVSLSPSSWNLVLSGAPPNTPFSINGTVAGLSDTVGNATVTAGGATYRDNGTHNEAWSIGPYSVSVTYSINVPPPVAAGTPSTTQAGFVASGGGYCPGGMTYFTNSAGTTGCGQAADVAAAVAAGSAHLAGLNMNNGLNQLRGVIPIGNQMLQRASHDPQIAALLGRDPRALLTANQWNYYYSQATGELQSAELNPPGFPHALMSAQDYQLARAAHGLPVTLAQQKLGVIRNSAPGMFPLGGIGNGPDRLPYLPPGNRNIYRIPGRGATTKLGVVHDGGGRHRWQRSPFPRPANWREAE